MLSSGATELSDTGLTPGRRYDYRVATVEGGVEGPYSDAVPAPAADVPGPVVELRATVSTLGRVQLSWSPADTCCLAVRNYEVVRRDVRGGQVELVGVPREEGYEDREVRPEGEYEYEVRARNSAGHGAAATVDVAVFGRPDAPSAFRASAEHRAGHLRLDWSYTGRWGGTVMDYIVTRTGPDGTTRRPTALRGDQHLVDDGLAPATQYEYRVQAVNVWGRGSEAVLVLRTPGLPDAPERVHAHSEVLSARAGTAQVSWVRGADGGAPLLRYEVWRQVDEEPAVLLATVGADHEEYQDTPPLTGRAVRYAVRAVNVVGAGPRSDAALLQRRLTLPQPTALASRRQDR